MSQLFFLEIIYQQGYDILLLESNASVVYM